MKKKGVKTQADIDWENRKLCIDESCIGVIGSNGRCKECGKSFESKTTDGTTTQEEETSQSTVETEESTPETVTEAPSDKTDEFRPQTDIDWENRTLCSDESCIGVVGPDGLCKECGKAATN